MKADIKKQLKETFPFLNYISKKKRSIPYNIERNINVKRAKKKIADKLKKGEKINVVFFESRKQIWFFDGLVELFLSDNQFDVKVVAIPFAIDGYEEMVHYMDELSDMLKERGVDCIKGYNKTTDSYLDVKKSYAPDIILFTQSYDLHTVPEFYMNRFDESLNYFVSYALRVVDNAGTFASRSNFLAYKDYFESDLLFDVAQSCRMDGVPNYSPLGSPKLDCFFSKKESCYDPWKSDGEKKRIIWAPHHSFKETGDSYIVASFLEIYDFMIKVARDYEDKIEIVFKPHPLLRHELERYWSTDRINNYYKMWDDMPNTQFVDGPYYDLFITSDAMIFDCLSFMLEYLVTGKPILFTICKEAKLSFNQFGNKLFDHIYKTNEIKKDIISFIDNVVISENDYMKEERVSFVKHHIRKEGSKSASELIFEDIKKDIRESR